MDHCPTQMESLDKNSNCSTTISIPSQDSQDGIPLVSCKKLDGDCQAKQANDQVLDFSFLEMMKSPSSSSNTLQTPPQEIIINNEIAQQVPQIQNEDAFPDFDPEIWEDIENEARQAHRHAQVIHEKLPEIEAKLYLQRNIGFFAFVSTVLLCLFLMVEGYVTSNFLFFPIYIYLSYHLYETKKRRACLTRDDWRVKEDSFGFFDNLNMMFFAASIQLIHNKIVNICNLIFVFQFLTTVFYYGISSAPQATKMTRTVVRSIFSFQFLLISLKLTGELHWEWKYTLALFWLYLGVVTVYLVAYTSILILLATLTILGRQQSGEIDLWTQFRGLIWHCTYYSLGGVAAVLIIGLNDYNVDNSTSMLRLAAMIGIGLSTFLAIYTFFLVTPLTKYIQIFSLSDGAVFSSEVQGNFFEERDESEVKITIVQEEKETFMIMLSSTYFKILSDNMGQLVKTILNNMNGLKNNSEFLNSIIKQAEGDLNAELEGYLTQQQRNQEENEDNICYLCCERQSNAVLSRCGHGGICSCCAVNLLAKKSECMGCRSIVDSFFKIDPQYRISNIMKSKELCKIIKN